MRFPAHALPVSLDRGMVVPPLMRGAAQTRGLRPPPSGRDRCRDCLLLGGVLAAV